MVIDYSKWDNLSCSEDEEPEGYGGDAGVASELLEKLLENPPQPPPEAPRGASSEMKESGFAPSLYEDDVPDLERNAPS